MGGDYVVTPDHLRGESSFELAGRDEPRRVDVASPPPPEPEVPPVRRTDPDDPW